MSFENTFCSSPWFHMRINNRGDFRFCRWIRGSDGLVGNIADISPIDFFQQTMSTIRHGMLQGQELSACGSCYLAEQHGKVLGRKKQLLKVGINIDEFPQTLLSSPWYKEFQHSDSTDGHTTLWPQDWQIDLGNYCNSACIMCKPESSSMLAVEFKKLGIIQKLPMSSWCQDPVLLTRFIDTLRESPKIQYLHFIGGETIITPAFRTILTALIDAGLHTTASIGFTTNLTVWDDSINALLSQFHEVNLGVSVETLDHVNDYVRWPSNITSVKEVLSQWINFGRKHKWLIQIRPTPSILTIGHMLPLWDYALTNNVSIESCNFLYRPDYMCPDVLPIDIRKTIINDMEEWLSDKIMSSELIINSRNPEFIYQQVIQDLYSYVQYLNNQSDESHKLPELVKYLKLIETSRNNKIIDYLPEYEQIFRLHGY